MTATMNVMNPMDNEVNVEAIEDMANVILAEAQYEEYQLTRSYEDMLIPTEDPDFGLEDGYYYTPEELDAMEAQRKAGLKAELDAAIDAVRAKLDAEMDMLFDCCAVCA